MGDSLMDVQRMNEILKDTIETINDGRKELLEIAEHAKEEYEKVKVELKTVKTKVGNIIDEVDFLEVEEKKSRSELAKVSRNFNLYDEKDIRCAYEKANDLRIQLMLKGEEERALIEKRSELELRLKESLEVLKKAEDLVSHVGVAMKYLNGNLDDILVTVDDMSKKQYLGVKIIEAQEEERKRLARDMHDGPAQSMANILIKAEICERLIEIDRDKSKIELKNLKEIVRSTLNDIRKIIYDLRPMSLDDLGLVPTVERYVYNFIEETNIDVKMNVLGDMDGLESVVKIAAFRIIQESLNNIRKHSKANNVVISLEKSLSGLNVIITDDGVGFDVEAISNKDISINNGFGLMSMKERAELLNGKLHINSSPGVGTRVFLSIPIEKEEDSIEK